MITIFNYQAFAIHEPALSARIRQIEPLISYCASHQFTDSKVCRTCSHEQQSLLLQISTGHPQCSDQASQSHARRPLNVVVERTSLVSVALQQFDGIVGCEVFELQQRPGEYLPNRSYEFIHQFKIRRLLEPWLSTS